jgi:4a-hydroxytetrahydrobiopterin dehydratase
MHFNIDLSHEQAESRIAAVLAAGGTLASDEFAPSFWVFADAEGKEACICTWLGRKKPTVS